MIEERYTGTFEIKNDNSKNLLLSKEAYIQELEQENEKLHSIINEVREFAINNTVRGLYELLDKENK